MADRAGAQALVLEAPRSPARRGPSWSLAPEVSAVTLPGVWPDLICSRSYACWVHSA